MNLLQTQDSLKNFSDQQLMSEMNDPTGQVPQFLVLSELKRRKDMRGQVQPPTQTVAEDITSGSTPQAMTPTPASQGAGAGVGQVMAPIPGMREGGVVRMQAGGQPPSTERLPFLNPNLSFPTATSRTTPLDVATQELEMNRQAGASIDPAMIQQMAQQYGVAPQALMSRFGIQTPSEMIPSNPTRMTGAPPPAATPENAPPAASESVTPPRDDGEIPLPPPYAAPPAPQRGTGVPRPNAGPLGALAESINPPTAAAAAPQGMQAPSSSIDRSAFNQILERMRRGETDQVQARQDARNMALIQAGLAIAGGTSPHFATNLAGAIPHLQNYQTRVSDIRKEGREELKNQFDLAKADLEAQFNQGRLTQEEYRTQMQRVIHAEDRASAERVARIGAGASHANAAAMRGERAAAREDAAAGRREALDVRRQEAVIRALQNDPEAKQLAETASTFANSDRGRTARTQLEVRRRQLTSQYNAMMGITEGDLSRPEDGSINYVRGTRP